jgi:GNAT superfamily N-acetyltransferase
MLDENEVEWKKARLLESTGEKGKLISCDSEMEGYRRIKAADIIRFHCINQTGTTSESLVSFTHQFFENEEVLLKNDRVRVHIYFHSQSFRVFVAIENTDDISLDYINLMNILQKHFLTETASFGHISTLQHWFIQTNVKVECEGIGEIIVASPISDGYLQLRLSTFKTPGADVFLKTVEKLSLWYIETADSIDFSDPRFELIIAYKSSTPDGDAFNSICGYMTLFTFLNPFTGNILRICQVLVFPHLQGSGIGREMILAAYRLAESRPHVIEVTVEDPAEGFSRLRDAVDVEWLLLNKAYIREVNSNKIIEAATARRIKIKITQYIFALEALEFMKLSRKHVTTGQDEGEDYCREFRLKVKRRLMKDNADLKTASKEKLREYLDELYEEMKLRYLSVERNKFVKLLYDNTF